MDYLKPLENQVSPKNYFLFFFFLFPLLIFSLFLLISRLFFIFYLFSGMTPMAMGEIFGELMLNLGYENYVVQGGDWGSVVCSYMGANDPRFYLIHSQSFLIFSNFFFRVIGVHLNMIPTLPPLAGKGFLFLKLMNIFALFTHSFIIIIIMIMIIINKTGIFASIETGLKTIFPFLHEDPNHGEKVLKIILKELGYMHEQVNLPSISDIQFQIFF